VLDELGSGTVQEHHIDVWQQPKKQKTKKKKQK
jgi:hypothetical protein